MALEKAIVRCLDLLGGLARGITSGDRVMVKPNFNSPDPFPGSTDLEFLRCVLQILQEAGAKVLVGESAGGMWRPTRKVVQRLGVDSLLSRVGVELVIFEERPQDWVEIEIGGDYLQKVTVPRSAYEADRLVNLPCMKTHRMARFSLSHHGIKYHFWRVIPHILNQKGDDLCPMEELSLGKTPEEFYRLLRGKAVS